MIFPNSKIGQIDLKVIREDYDDVLRLAHAPVTPYRGENRLFFYSDFLFADGGALDRK